MASLRKKSSSKFWFACFTLPDGSRTQRSTKTTDRRTAQKLADQFEEASRIPLTETQARRVISDIHKSLSGKALQSQSVRDFLTQWVGARKGTVALGTFREYESTVADFIEYLGERARVDLAFLTPVDVAGFRDATGARLSVGSANKKLKIVRVALQQAWRDGIVEHNPAAKVQILKAHPDSQERRAFRLEELQRLVSVAEGEWKGLILFGIYTGQRLGDIARIRWEHLDGDLTTLSFSTRKTGRRQIIPIARPLRAWLAALPRHKTGFLFEKAGKSVEKSATVGRLSNQFHAILAKCGLVEHRDHNRKAGGTGRDSKREASELSFHSLRHTATSLMKNAGISPAIVQEFVGHESKAVSQNYTHIETEALRKAADALPDLLTPTAPIEQPTAAVEAASSLPQAD